MIADLVHHVREDLSIGTLSHVVHIYSCNLHDPSLAPSIQTMCSKLLLNLTENVVKTESEEASLVLSRSLEAFVTKVEAVAATRDSWKKWMKSVNAHANKEEGIQLIDEVDVERAKPIAQFAAMTDNATDLLRGALADF
jgi:transformation/transcription domain-associated protein